MGSFPSERPDWANLSILHRNTLDPRANFKLYNSEEDALSRDETKARGISLAGNWKFNLVNSPFEAPEDFEATTFDSSKWSDIAVPGMWQLQGFGKGPHYTNVQFPFFVDPPYPPYTDNETGSYLTTFTVPKDLADDQLRLRFEGVDAAYHVWVNGKEVGYSQGSRNPDEFDISDFVNRGEKNVLAVRVYQFCDASYIEDQDQWWLSGIFRDVFLLGFPKKQRFEDIDIHTILDDKYEDATLKVSVKTSGSGNVKLRLLDGSQKQIAYESQPVSDGKTLEMSVPVSRPHKWTAETPHLYHLVLSLDNKQFIARRVGFRQVELKDGLIQVNGKRVVFKGANRHEHHPEHGRAVPYEFMKQDLLLMKTHNINAIRTCHQPCDPRFYDLADELGFWVMDEADLECHGFETIADAALSPAEKALSFFDRQQLTKGNAAKWTSDNPEWQDAYVDRAKHLVHRDKLHASVIVWSLGNEAFYGRNHTAMADWIRSYDTTRLIHYEPDLDAKHMDMHSRMYPYLDKIVEFAEDKSKTKPLVLCEYIHAMGTGPGNIKEYVDAFYKYPALQGGWVWEWANHGLLTKNNDGEPYYGYGGDFGDVPHDGNFVMDGVLDSDHSANSGLIEYKKALEPVQLVSASAESAKVVNRFDFDTLDHLECKWSRVIDAGSSAGGSIDVPRDLKPGATAEIALPRVNVENGKEALVELSFRLKSDTNWAKAGHEVAFLQIPVSPPAAIQTPEARSQESVTVKQEAAVLTISGGKSKWSVSLASGALTSWKKIGSEVLAQALEPSFFRAPTDNDAPQDGWDWLDKKLDLASIHTRNVSWQTKDDGVVVSIQQKFAPRVLSWSLDLETELTFTNSGALWCRVKGTPAGINLPKTLPRIGVTLGLPKSFQNVEWFGRGPGESYKDMKLSQRVDLHKVPKVSDLWTAPEFPQECSNRTDTRWLKISSSSDNNSLTAQFYTPGKPNERHLFDFMASHFDVKDIAEAKHPYELEKKRKDLVVLRLDADHHGLGTGSCGPKTLDEYALKTQPFEFGLVLY